MRKTIFVTTALAALAVSTAGWAQDRDKEGAGAPGMSTGGPAETKEAPNGQRDKMNAPPRGGKAMSQEEEKKPGAGMKAEEKAPGAGMKPGEKAPGTGTKAEEQSGEQKGEQRGQATERGQQPQPSAASGERQPEGRQGAENAGGGLGAGQISSEQQTRLRTGFKGVQIHEATGINVTNVRVGVSVPRTVTEYWEPVPAQILTIVPAWRDYRIVRVGEEIIVIDPASFEVVYVFS